MMGSLDKVVFHGRGVASQAYVVGDVVGDLALVMEECSTGARDPNGEEAGPMLWCGVNGIGMLVG